MRDLQPNLPLLTRSGNWFPTDIGRQSDHKFRDALDASFMSLLPSHTHSGSARVRILAGEFLVLVVEMSFLLLRYEECCVTTILAPLSRFDALRSS